MKYWLMKSEPDVWSIDQQKNAGLKGTPWNGVKNYQAAKNLIASIFQQNQGGHLTKMLSFSKVLDKTKDKF